MESDVLRFRHGLQRRLDEINRGECIELEGDDALRDFFAGIEAEVNAELAARVKHGE